MSKTLLVLAASIYQVPTIEAAKRLGYRVVTTDNVAANPGHAIADKSYDIDTTDDKAVFNLAVQENISGIIAPGTDVAVMTAAKVAERLQLPGPPSEAARILTNKFSFRQFLESSGLHCPRSYLVDGYAGRPAGIFDGRSWLVKPCRASGSKGVFIVDDEQSFMKREAESRAFSLDGMAVIEEFIEGSQHTCEGVLENGRVTLALITDRDTAPPPYTTTIGHRVPCSLPEAMQLRALLVIEEVFRRLGVKSGPFDCDFVSAGDRIVLIEMTPRLGGNSLSKLFKVALNFDLVGYAVAHACGDPTPLPLMNLLQPSAIAILGTERAGLLAWNQGEAKVLSEENWVHALLIDHPLGTPVKPFINGRHRVGEALILATNRSDLDTRLLDLKRRLALTAT